ncbi:related to cytochrome P450 [Phialocephala subalpina]|uniref:Related to cytochrome P450 n=1 Tax=Phialocephala subalpina TaxID=576137 RepID=A0A1L7XPM6_9HELO|nr:related to cytochrome P450 [Phialocephala subalpina]
MAVLAGLLILATAWLFQILHRAYSTPLRQIPGPWYAPFTHLVLKAQVLQGRRLHYIHDLHERYGPIVRIAPKEVAISDFDAFSEIHRINSGYHKTLWYEMVNNQEVPGIFAIRDPKQHAQRRRLLARGFSKSYLKEYWEDSIREKAELAVAKIKRDATKGSADILKWWTFYTTDKNQYMRAVELNLFAGGMHAEFPIMWDVIWSICNYLPLQSLRQLFHYQEYTMEYASRAVNNSKSQDGNTKTIFSTIIAEAGKEDTPLTDKQVKLEAGNMIVAGSDTTAVTLTYLIWAVLKKPELRKDLEEEVRELKEDFTDTDLETLPLLNATIEEALRLYSAAPASLPRQTPANGATLCRYKLPGNITVCTQAYTIHRDPNMFSDPDNFDPTRFLHPETLPPNSSAALHPFGAGSRICLGIHLARTELRLATALFFRECVGARLAGTTTDESMEMENFFLIQPKAHRCEIVL